MATNFTWIPPVINHEDFKDMEVNEFLNKTSPENPQVIHFISLSSSSLATVAGILLLFLLFRRVIRLDRDFRVMFANLTLADLMTAIGLLSSAIQNIRVYPDHISDDLCISQSFVSTMSVMASFLWTIVIGIVCFRDTWYYGHTPPLRIRSMQFVVLHLLCWGIPFGIVMAAWQFDILGENNLQNTAGWCWVRSCDDTCTWAQRVKLFLWMLFTGKLWECLSYLSIVNIFILGYFLHFRKSNAVATNFAASIPHAKIEVASHSGFMDSISRVSVDTHYTFYNSFSFNLRSEDSSDDNVAKLLLWIPVALIFARIWGTVRFVFDSLMLLQPSLQLDDLPAFDNVFMYFQAVGDCSQTTCNFILALIFSQNVRNFLLCRPWRAKNYEEF